MTRYVLMTMLLAVPLAAAPAKHTLSFTKVWTRGHTTADQVSEIPAFDHKTSTIWVAGVVGVDVLDAATGKPVEHIDVTGYGLVNSVAIHNGLAALAIEAAPDRRQPGVVVFYETRTLQPIGDPVTVGALPDMLTFTHDGSKLLVANEGTPNAVADTPYTLMQDPRGTVSIIDVETRTVIATAGFENVPRLGTNLRTNVGMDFEPEYIAVEKDGSRAFVTLQEANAIAALDLSSNAFTEIIGLGAKDFSLPENIFDPKDNNAVDFVTANAKGLYMPDGIVSYKVRGRTYLVLANEGDFREDNVDRASAGSAPYSAAAPLDRLRISNADSSPGNLFAAGARSMSIRDAEGTLVYDSGSILDLEAHKRGVYDDGRSRDKGVEPEGVALMDIGGRTYAFVGLERTTSSAIAVFDITDPHDAQFLDMIVTPGDLSPEGLAAFELRGDTYLAIANEVRAPGALTANTTLYRVDRVKH
jgi:DNA-binding beta-propeller fold protein YncE